MTSETEEPQRPGGGGPGREEQEVEATASGQTDQLNPRDAGGRNPPENELRQRMGGSAGAQESGPSTSTRLPQPRVSKWRAGC
jgi:hypothetical protein